MRAPARRWWRGLHLVLLLVTLLAFGGGAATTATPAHAPAAISILSDLARSNFPDGITFRLTATSPRPISRVELYYNVAGQETLNLETPPIEAGGRVVAVVHEVELDGGALPPGLEISYFWRLIDSDGGSFDTEPGRIAWEDTRFSWDTLGSDLVTVHSYQRDDAFNQALLDSATRTIDTLQTNYGVRLRDPVRIWIYASSDDLYSALRPNSEPWLAGAAYPALGLVLGIVPADDPSEMGRLIPHEVSHLVLYQATLNPFNTPPTWLDEGLATLVQEEPEAAYPIVLTAAIDEGRLDSLHALGGAFPYDTDDALLAYAESVSVVRFILREYGEDGLARLIAVLRQGVTDEQAVEEALAISLDDLTVAWHDALAADDGSLIGAIEARGSGRFGGGEAVLLASGAAIMGVVALLALLSGALAMRRGRLRDDPDEREAAGASSRVV